MQMQKLQSTHSASATDLIAYGARKEGFVVEVSTLMVARVSSCYAAVPRCGAIIIHHVH